MRRPIHLIILLLFFPFLAKTQQVGIGTNQPVAGAILDISDTARGVVFPRMGTAARLRLPNTKGMIVFDTVAASFYFNDGAGWTNLPPKPTTTGDMIYWNGSSWVTIPAGLGGQVLTLSSGTHIPFWNGPTTDTLFTDPRDNQQYRIKQFGSQIWMTQNLNYSIMIDGWCYNYADSNCNTYGRLYDLTDARGIATPPGWHLPSDAEWDTLINFLGGPSVAGGVLKSLSFWNAPNTGATNSSDFNALPAGWFYHYLPWTGIFTSLGNEAFFWSSTSATAFSVVWARRLNNVSGTVERVQFDGTDGASARYIKN